MDWDGRFIDLNKTIIEAYLFTNFHVLGLCEAGLPLPHISDRWLVTAVKHGIIIMPLLCSSLLECSFESFIWDILGKLVIIHKRESSLRASEMEGCCKIRIRFPNFLCGYLHDEPFISS